MHVDTDLQRVGRKIIPAVLLGQGWWRAANHHRHEFGVRRQRDGRGTTAQMHQATKFGARTFRKNQQRAAGTNDVGATREQRGSVQVIVNVTRGNHHTGHERVSPRRTLHDALQLRGNGQQQNHVDQAGMIGRDDSAACAQSRHAVDRYVNESHQLHEPGEENESATDRTPHAGLALPLVG